jgi:hypothetical protein
MSIEMKSGQAIEKAALGHIDKEKEKVAMMVYIKAKTMKQMFPGISEDVVKRMLRADAELKRIFENKVISNYGVEMSKDNETICLEKTHAIEVVKACQPPNRKDFADDLYFKVAELLGLEEMDENDDFVDLKFYTAVKSKLDFVFKIDCLFIFTYLDSRKNKKKLEYYIDVTLKDHKENKNVDLILYLKEDSLDQRSNWMPKVNSYSETIVNKLNLERNGK